MTSLSLPNKVSYFLLLIKTLAFFSSPSVAQNTCGITTVFQFGDSLSDGGNSVIFSNGIAKKTYGFPYGETYFKRPTGRYSDGRIVPDFIVQALKLPLLNAYLDKKASFRQGVNFAFSAATALNNSFWTARNVKLNPQNKHLTIQLGWFKSHLQSTYGSNSANVLKKSLVVLGEFGGADYIFSYGQGKKVPEMKRYVPFVVAGIMQGIRDVIKLGATRILVPGVLPFGCLPNYWGQNPKVYDSTGCLASLNEFCSFHNTELKKALQNLQRQFPGVTIVYADYYEGYLNNIRKASLFGFEKFFAACCGGGCRVGSKACPNPAKSISWDGSHMTDAGSKHVADFVLNQVLPQFKCSRFGDSVALASS